MSKFIKLEANARDGKDPKYILVNLDRIAAVEACVGGTSNIIMSGCDCIIEISYRQTQELMEYLRNQGSLLEIEARYDALHLHPRGQRLAEYDDE